MDKYIVVFALLLAGCSNPSPGDTNAGSGTNKQAPSAAASNTNRQVFQVKGVIQEVNLEGKKAVIRHEEIPDYMPAMTMPFDVRHTNELTGLKAGDEVTFTMLVTEDDGWIENIKKTGIATNTAPNTPPKQRQNNRLVRDVEPLEIGDKMPNYTFTNSFGKTVSFADFPGQAIAFTFIFTRCPFPTFCPRMSSNLSDAYELLRNDPNAPTNWHLFSISFDPDFDTPERLQSYSAVYKPDPKKWDWVTGAMIDIDAITEQVGLVYATEGATINHNLRTVVVDASGVIRTNFWGNEWKPEELARQIREAAQVKAPAN